MKISDDKKCLAAFERWQESASEEAQCEVDARTAYAPEMTPIEQIVFFTLGKIERELNIASAPQFQIGKYRVDFLVKKFDGPREVDQIVIECDGHDFHERTKEQAQRDKNRDRELQDLGFKVYRFTGSEIWKTNGECVAKALGVEI